MSAEHLKIVAETQDSVFVRQEIPKTHYTRRAFLCLSGTAITALTVDLKFFNSNLTKRLIRETLKAVQSKDQKSPPVDLELSNSVKILVSPNIEPEPLDLILNNPNETIPNLDVAENKYLPVENGVRRLRFGQKISYTTYWTEGSKKFHNALDIQSTKNAPVYSPAEGIVEWVGPIYRAEAQGNQVVVIYYPEYNLCTSYGHNNKALVEIGQKVQKGTPIALLGDQGYCTPGYYHIHWEVWQGAKFTGNWQNPWTGGEPINPEIFLNLLNK